MFASLLGRHDQHKATSPLLRRPLPARGRTTATPLPFSLTEAELDHLVDRWARKSPEPVTATIRSRLFAQHLTVTLETHPLYEQVLVQARAGSIVPITSLSALIETIVDRTMRALYAARMPHAAGATNDDRFAVGIPAFTQELNDALTTFDDPHHRNLVDYMGLDQIAAIIRDTLTSISQEYVLARQIADTAKMIRSMNDLLARAALPDEDLYELKLRRDLFLTDLRVYNRLTRVAMTGVNGSTRQQSRPAPAPAAATPGLFSRIFESCDSLRHAITGIIS